MDVTFPTEKPELTSVPPLPLVSIPFRVFWVLCPGLHAAPRREHPHRKPELQTGEFVSETLLTSCSCCWRNKGDTKYIFSAAVLGADPSDGVREPEDAEPRAQRADPRRPLWRAELRAHRRARPRREGGRGELHQVSTPSTRRVENRFKRFHFLLTGFVGLSLSGRRQPTSSTTATTTTTKRAMWKSETWERKDLSFLFCFLAAFQFVLSKYHVVAADWTKTSLKGLGKKKVPLFLLIRYSP